MSDKPPTFNELAKALGCSSANINKLKKRGMRPEDGLEACKAWYGANVKNPKANKAPAKVNLVSLKPVDLGQVTVTDAQYSNQSALKRALVAEEQAGELLKRAIESGQAGAVRSLIQVHTEAAKARVTAKEAFLNLETKEGNLIAKDWVIKRDNQLFGLVNTLLDALPDSIAAGLMLENPEEIKEAARKEIKSLREKVLKRLEALSVE